MFKTRLCANWRLKSSITGFITHVIVLSIMIGRVTLTTFKIKLMSPTPETMHTKHCTYRNQSRVCNKQDMLAPCHGVRLDIGDQYT